MFYKSSAFYKETIYFKDYDAAIKYIKKKIYALNQVDYISLEYLNCGFLNHKLGDYYSAIDHFTKTIHFESELEYYVNEDLKKKNEIDLR